MKKLVFGLICGFVKLYGGDDCQADCFMQGDAMLPSQNSPAYNSPASIALKNGYGCFLTASYLYWDAQEEGLDLATTAAFETLTNTVIPPANESKTIFQPSKYSSGFKVGIGYSSDFDDWVLRADFTYLHQDTHKSSSAPQTSNGTGALFMTSWFLQTSAQNQAPAFSHLSSSWSLGLQWLDLTLERPFYSGARFTLTPFFGLKASWINQSLKIESKNPLNFGFDGFHAHSKNHQSSWGLGPYGGVGGHWLIGRGWRVESDFGAALLLTRYTHVKHSEDSFALGGLDVKYAYHNYNCLRPVLEASLGIGWGSYLWQNRYHLDFSASYDWHYFWNQNLIRQLNDEWIIGTGASAQTLTIQGLVLAARFDF